MQCQCGYTAQYIIGRDGKPSHICARNRCKFWAIGPTSCEGYPRVVLGCSHPPPGTVIVRFEALLHPEFKNTSQPLPAVMAMCEGYLHLNHPVRQILEDPAYEGKWFPGKKAYLYTLNYYAPLLTSLQQLAKSANSSTMNCSRRPHDSISSSTLFLSLLLEPIPNFFFKCLDEGNQNARQFASVHPDLEDIVYQKLQPFQKKGVEFLLQHGGRGMIADEMGLGKTIQAIAVAHFYRDEWPLLVVCPMSLMENWAKEICRFCSIPFSRIGFIQGKKILAYTGEEGQHGIQDIIIASYHALKELKMAVFQIIIFDESHYIKTPDSKRTVAALELSKKAKRVVLLTGTPTLSRPMELYTQLRAIASLRHGLLPTNNQFAARYCNAHIQSRGGMYTVNSDGHSHTDELHLLLQHFLIRREKKELQHALPSKSRQILYVTVPEKGRASIAKLVSGLKKNVASQIETSGSGNPLLTSNAKDADEEWVSHRSFPNAFELKIATAQVKIPAVIDYVASMVEKHRLSKQKMIVFGHHQCMMDALKEAVEKAGKSYPVDYILISGETPAGQREELAEHFRSDPHCIAALLTMQSSGVGHNFTCASTVIFSELDWNPSTHLQCEDRVHRIGQSKPCVIQYLLAEGTSDSIIWPLLNTKLSVTTAVLSGSGGGNRETESKGNCESSPRCSSQGVKANGEKKLAVGCSNVSLLEAEVSERKHLGIGNGASESAFGSQISNGGGGTQKKLDEFFSGSSSQSSCTAVPHSIEGSTKAVLLSTHSGEYGSKNGISSPPSAPLSSSSLVSLPLLVSFAEMSAIDSKWKDTAHALPIPGCYQNTELPSSVSPASRRLSQPLSDLSRSSVPSESACSSSGRAPTSSSTLSSFLVPQGVGPGGRSVSDAADLHESQILQAHATCTAPGNTSSCASAPPRRTTFTLQRQAPLTSSSSIVASPSMITSHSNPLEPTREEETTNQEGVVTTFPGESLTGHASSLWVQKDPSTVITCHNSSSTLSSIAPISQSLSLPFVRESFITDTADFSRLKRRRVGEGAMDSQEDPIEDPRKKKQAHWGKERSEEHSLIFHSSSEERHFSSGSPSAYLGTIPSPLSPPRRRGGTLLSTDDPHPVFNFLDEKRSSLLADHRDGAEVKVQKDWNDGRRMNSSRNAAASAGECKASAVAPSRFPLSSTELQGIEVVVTPSTTLHSMGSTSGPPVVRRTIISLKGGTPLQGRERSRSSTEPSGGYQQKSLENLRSCDPSVSSPPLSLEASPTTNGTATTSRIVSSSEVSCEQNSTLVPPFRTPTTANISLAPSVHYERSHGFAHPQANELTFLSLSPSTSVSAEESPIPSSTGRTPCSAPFPDSMQPWKPSMTPSSVRSSSSTAHRIGKRTTILLKANSVSPPTSVGCEGKESESSESVRRTMISLSPSISSFPTFSAVTSPPVLPNANEATTSFSAPFPVAPVSSTTDTFLANSPSSPPPPLGCDALLQAVSRMPGGSTRGFTSKRTFLIRKPSS